jgi:hypothetical protein
MCKVNKVYKDPKVLRGIKVTKEPREIKGFKGCKE